MTTYDNLNINFTKLEQRLDTQSLFASGSAATVFVLETQTFLPLTHAHIEHNGNVNLGILSLHLTSWTLTTLPRIASLRSTDGKSQIFH